MAHCPATLPLLNFATVQADAVSLALENEEDGLSFEDICAGGFNEGLSLLGQAREGIPIGASGTLLKDVLSAGWGRTPFARSPCPRSSARAAGKVGRAVTAVPGVIYGLSVCPYFFTQVSRRLSG